MFPGYYGRFRPMRPFRMWRHHRPWRHMRHRGSCCCLPFFVLFMLPIGMLFVWGAMHIL